MSHHDEWEEYVTASEEIQELRRVRGRLHAQNGELLAALTAVDSEIALPGHLQELVSTAITNAENALFDEFDRTISRPPCKPLTQRLFRATERNGTWHVEADLPCINGLSAWVPIATLGPPDPSDEMFGGWDYRATAKQIAELLSKAST